MGFQKTLGHILACCFLSVWLANISAVRRPASSGQAKPATLIGEWGGPHVAVSVSAKGANLEFDCAHGHIDQPLRVDTRGRFSLRGMYVQEHGGPVRLGEVLDSRPALYSGRIDGMQMTIAVRLLSTDQPLGAFVAIKGQPARLFKCK